MKTPLIAIVAGFVALAMGCKKDEGSKPGDGDETPDTGKTADRPDEDSGPKKPEVVTRLFSCDFVAWEGEGEERQARFALTNEGTEPVERLQTWIYYYKDDKQIDRYPHALAQDFPPGKKIEKALGSKGAKIKEGVGVAACEVTEATYTNDETWSNLNLNYNRMMIPRPPKGETHEQLVARTGTAVKATWAGNTDSAARFKLENVKGEGLTTRTAWVYYYDIDGKQLGRAVSNLAEKLAAGASVEKELGYPADKIPEGTKFIEATVSSVELDKGGKWINRNLAPFERAMESKLPDASEDSKGE